MGTPRKLIILAEDDKDFAERATRAFQSLKYEVRLYKNGQLALDALRALSPEDRSNAIIVSDRTMPELTGVGLALAVRKEFPEIPFMMWTRGIGDDALKLRRAGAHHAIEKTPLPDRIKVALDITVREHAEAVSQPLPPGSNASPLDHALRPPQSGIGSVDH